MRSSEAKVSIRDQDAFVEMKNDFDNILKRTLVSLTEKDGNTAEITMKLKISIDKSCIKSFMGGMKDELIDVKSAYRPTFEHKLTSVIQTRDSIEGKMNDEVALIWDKDLEEFVLRSLDENEQLSLDFLGLDYENKKKPLNGREMAIYTQKQAAWSRILISMAKMTNQMYSSETRVVVIVMQRIILADAVHGLKMLLNESVNTCVTSPPYYGLRDYG